MSDDEPRFWSLFESVKAMVRRAFPDLFFRGVFRFRVAVDRGSGRFDLKPEKAKWLSDVPLAKVWPGLGGAAIEPMVGSFVLIAFIDADEGQPVIVGFQPLADENGQPTSIRVQAINVQVIASGNVTIDGGSIIMGDGAASFVRYGETVSVGTTAGPITFTSGLPPNPLIPSKVKG